MMNNNIRTFLISLLCVMTTICIVVGLTACQKQPQEEETTSETTQEETKEPSTLGQTENETQKVWDASILENMTVVDNELIQETETEAQEKKEIKALSYETELFRFEYPETWKVEKNYPLFTNPNDINAKPLENSVTITTLENDDNDNAELIGEIKIEYYDRLSDIAPIRDYYSKTIMLSPYIYNYTVYEAFEGTPPGVQDTKKIVLEFYNKESAFVVYVTTQKEGQKTGLSQYNDGLWIILNSLEPIAQKELRE